jgi:hypothetical protein
MKHPRQNASAVPRRASSRSRAPKLTDPSQPAAPANRENQKRHADELERLRNLNLNLQQLLDALMSPEN